MPFDQSKFSEIQAEVAERQKAKAEWFEMRKHTIQREHKTRDRKLDEMERLRQQAARLARKAGAKGTRASQFEGRSKNQLLMVIREAHNIIDLKNAP